jgi:hypothetical protein
LGATKHNNEQYDYVIELSTEFLVDKFKRKDETTDILPTMFLRSNPLDENRNTNRINLLYFAKNYESIINKIENLYNLLDNKNIKLIRDYFLTTNDQILTEQRKVVNYNKIVNLLDASLAIKHYVNSLLLPIMPTGVFRNIYKIMDEKVRRVVALHTKPLTDFLSYLNDEYIQTYLRRIPKFMIDYIKCVYQLIPIYDNYNEFKTLDMSKNGISSLNVDDLVVVYKKGYELLCDSLDLLIGVYNIEKNGAYNDFGDGPIDFSNKMNSFSSKFIKYETFTSYDSDLFEGIRGVLNSIIRNAEGHNSIKVNGLTQEITFINKHKGRKNECKKTFLEFGKECIDVFVAVLYVWEYYYQFTKFKSVLIDKTPLNYGNK